MKHSVLVVDDEETIRNTWRKALRHAGYQVFVAASADEALALCDEHPIDVVVLDFIMPSVDGVQLLVQIRKRLPFVRSVIVSGKLDSGVSASEISDELKASVESDLYLHKPLSNDELSAAVKRVLEQDPGSDWKALAEHESKTKRTTNKTATKASQSLKKRQRRC